MLADTNWDFGDFMLGVVWFFFFVIWLYLLFMVFADVFRRHDIGGGLKTVWVLFVLLMPYLGCFIYLISQGKGIAERGQAAHAAAVNQMRQDLNYSVADELEKLEALHAKGTLSDAEYEAARAKALG